ncbi:hypothetical protein FRZ44_18460 [Hypericibacter terrae]|uniref:DUF1062 domain-containing protein n=1 Tax=Hypericibacter terrae TaxID=2602015 RepID=A0A5J6MHI3_9PROT|nr:DUF1062 domain-containing protein [Hypericibacter terrae]QEX16551.1 hypothetical protein FRZ44_18460 [Hypericibacter terrae]
MQSLLQVQWRVTPLKTPRPWLHCPRCDARTPFVSSGKFRVNAQKKRLDAWLVYRCARCEQSWNFPLLERCPVNGIEPATLRALTENDAALAWHHAFDLTRLGRHSSQIESFAELSVEKQLLSPRDGVATHAEIAIAAPYDCGVRLDKLLASEFGLSRSAIERLADAKALIVLPASRRTLKQGARDGQKITLDLGAPAFAEPSMLTRLWAAPSTPEAPRP